MGDLEWTNDLVIRLMQEYARRPELWDSSHEMYRVQTMKYETWRELAGMFECNVADLRKKLNSLFASHRREKAKIRAGGRSTWFLYPYMGFLPSHLDADSGNLTVSQTVTVESKPRPPVKEVPPPPSSSSELDAEEEPLQTEEVLVNVKQEPMLHYQPQQQYRARTFKRHAIHHKPRLTRPVRRRVVHKETREPRESRETSILHSSSEEKLAEALRLLRRADHRKKDECDSFGEYIADSLRKHDERTQSMIKQAINNILFEQEMKKYNSNQQYTVVIAGMDENPLILGDESTETDK